MIGFDEAIALLREAARPLGDEAVRLDQAHRRVVARAVTAQVSAPSCDVSAMDGYAVREEDLGGVPVRLAVAGESFPASGHSAPLEPGECVRIFTGAPLPFGADRVVIQEKVRREGDFAIVDEHPGGPRHMRSRGSDFEHGDILVEPGTLLNARALVAAAAADVALLDVWRRPMLIILGTGDELAEPGKARDRPGAIPDSVSLAAAALAETWGAQVLGRRRIADDLTAMKLAAAEALDAADLVVVTGGASVGERDHARAMFEPAGLELVFSKVAIKPGKPVWLGRAKGRLVIGLPGNPTSALVTARLFLAPLLAGLAGRDPSAALRWRKAPLAEAIGSCGSRETFARACWAGDAARLLPNQDSGAQRTLAAADLLLRRRPFSEAVEAGELVEVIDF